MIVICAWCDEEGHQNVIRVGASDHEPGTSHGICDRHEQALIRTIHALRKASGSRGIEPTDPSFPVRSTVSPPSIAPTA